MSKGNMFLGYARGKVGSVVFSRLYGQQITRAYNAKPANPKSYAQARQRMLFSSISQYYKAFRYLIEQGQQGINEGNESVREWQRKTLRQLSQIAANGVLMPNAYGVQAPQLLPISLTDGNLTKVDYTITGKTNSAGDTHYYITMPFKGQYTSVADLAAMTLGDFYSLYPTIQKGAQLTFVALAWSVDYDLYDYWNRAYQPIWAQYVFDPNADETLPFFVASSVEGRYVINPELLLSSWGEKFEPEIFLELVDGVAVARFGESDFITDGSGGLIAGAIITSYYNGTQWARSNSPFAIAPGYTTNNIDAIIATYQRRSKNTNSDRYLNQAEAQAAANAAIRMIRTSVGDFYTGESGALNQTIGVYAPDTTGYTGLAAVVLTIEGTGAIEIANLTATQTSGEGGIVVGTPIVTGGGSSSVTITIPVERIPIEGDELEVVFDAGGSHFIRFMMFNYRSL